MKVNKQVPVTAEPFRQLLHLALYIKQTSNTPNKHFSFFDVQIITFRRDKIEAGFLSVSFEEEKNKRMFLFIYFHYLHFLI